MVLNKRIGLAGVGILAAMWFLVAEVAQDRDRARDIEAMKAGPQTPAGMMECEVDETCAFECPDGGCTQRCRPRSTCTATCQGGGCKQNCGGGAECDFDCAGGDCLQACRRHGSCELTCADGTCRQQCADDAKRCAMK